MYYQQVKIINTLQMCMDAFAICASGFTAYLLLHYLLPEISIPIATYIPAIIIMMLMNTYIMGHFRLYGDKKQASYLDLVRAIFKTVFVELAILSFALLVFNELYQYRLFFMLIIGFNFTFLIIERGLLRLYFNNLLQRGFNSRQILLVGDIHRGRIVAEQLQTQMSLGHKIMGHLSTGAANGHGPESLGSIDDLADILQRYAIDEVIFTLGNDRSVKLSQYLDICFRMGVAFRILPALWKPKVNSITVELCQDLPFLSYYPNNFNMTGLFYKRALDIIGGLVGVSIFIVLYPFVAIATKLDSPGPVIFKQKRLSKNGRIFDLYKFRSMHVGAEQQKKGMLNENDMNGPIFKIKNDPRITRVGKWLRKTSLDEVPQFVNVLRGEMSLVGTRPPTIEEAEQYEEWHYRRISAKPGITGLWQISGRNTINNFDDIVELDCEYVKRWRFKDDIIILFKTIWVVLLHRGAR